MRRRPILARVLAWLLVSVASLPLAAPVRAADHCRVGVAADGAIRVRARNVVGALHWGGELGQETNAFFNAATCVVGSSANQCFLGAEGTVDRVTPPPSCTIFLRDAGTAACAAYVPRCIPTPSPIACALFPAGNVWNRDVSTLPVHAQSAAWIASIGAAAPLHPDFGSGLYAGRPIGIPYTLVPSIQPLVPVSFTYADESDPGPYPIPPFAPIEGGKRPGQGRGDRHVLIVDRDTCHLYEVYSAHWKKRGASWTAGSGAVWDLTSNALRPDTWTSADAAGLPILPGLTRYDEVAAGAIEHALRFTAPLTQRAYLWPARHFASSSTDPSLPPLGIRLRLKAGVDVSGFSAANQVILSALKSYGMFLADNGSSMFLSGAPNPGWDNDDLHQLTQLHGSDFEVVDESSLQVAPDSGQAN
jgi:hypothetical protein